MTIRYACVLARVKDVDERKKIQALAGAKLVKAIVALPDNFELDKISVLLCGIEKIGAVLTTCIDRRLPSFFGDSSLQLIWFENEMRADDLEDWLNAWSVFLQGIEIEKVELKPMGIMNTAFGIEKVKDEVADFLRGKIDKIFRGGDVW